MIQSIRAAIKSLMTKAANAGLSEQLTILQGIDSNDQQIQDIVSKQPLYVYKATINQGDTEPPTAVVLINTFPSGLWAYNGEGVYSLNLGIDLSVLKVTTIQETCFDTGNIGGLICYISGYKTSGSAYQVSTADSSMTVADFCLVDYTITIEAYA
jgi:hypothetical protein